MAEATTFLSSIPPPGLRLAIVGAGAVGSELCRLLLLAGQKHVLLLDPDTPEPRNFALSALFRESPCGAGTPKVKIVQQAAMERGLRWDAVVAEIADVGWLDLQNSDVLICCADSVLARVETAFAARSLRLPMVDAAVHSAGLPGGRVACFPAFAESACYLCGLAAHRRAEVLAYARSNSLGCGDPLHFPPMSGTPTAVHAVAQAVLGVLTHLVPAQSYALRLGDTPEEILLSPSPDCPWHDLPDPAALRPLPFDEPIAGAFTKPDQALDLAWPICLRAQCRNCGALCAPRQRAAIVRRKVFCAQCGQGPGTLEPLDCLSTLLPGDVQASRTPRQLGLPSRHLYYVRSAMKRERPETR